MIDAKRVLVVLVLILAGAVLIAVASFPKATSPFAHLAAPCRTAAVGAPLDFPELSAIQDKRRSEKLQYLGECAAKRITDVLWFVSGVHYDNWMKEDGRSPVRYEAVVHEDNDARNPHVQKHGTQYTLCGVAAQGVDRTRFRNVRCGIGAYVLEFRKLYGLAASE